MPNLIINKSSSKYTVLSLGIAMFIFSIFFTFLFLGNEFAINNADSSSVVYELRDGYPANSLDLILKDIREIGNLETESSELILKKQAIKYFTNELTQKGLEELKSNNPFQDLVVLNFNAKLNDLEIQSLNQIKSKYDNFITEITMNTLENSPIWSHAKFLIVLIPFVLVSTFFYITIILGAVQNDLSLNQIEIKRSIIAGVDPKILFKNMRTIVVSNFVKGLILAFILYLLTFYLIKNYLNVNFSDFGFFIFLKPIFTSILLVFICLLLITRYKVSNFLKSI